MFKNILTLFGIGMIALWIVGLAQTPTTPYMTWLDGVAGLFSFIIAGSIQMTATRAARATSTLILSLCLFGLWLGGLLSGAIAWQVWWTFGAACAYFVLGVAGAFIGPSGGVSAGEAEQPRRAA